MSNNFNTQNISIIHEDISDTVDFILDRKVKEISPQIIEVLQKINPDIIKWNKKNELLETLINQWQVEDLSDVYFNLFSKNTKDFILKYLSNGIIWTLKIDIDTTLRGWSHSNKPVEVSIEWEDLENNIFYQIFEYHSITDIENICKELIDYHYLWLWLKWWFFDSIELHKKINTTKIIKNTKNQSEDKKINYKNSVTITYK